MEPNLDNNTPTSPASTSANDVIETKTIVEKPVETDRVASGPIDELAQDTNINNHEGDTPKKKGNGMLLGMICFLILAVGGIGFGVWAMMDKNTEITNLNDQISKLKSQINEKDETIEELNAEIESLQGTDGEKNDEEGALQFNTYEGVFTVSDEDGTVLAQEGDVKVAEISSCDKTKDETAIIYQCSITTVDGGSGVFEYDYLTEELTYKKAE